MIADYTRAIELRRNDANSYRRRGSAYAARGDNDRAVADFNRSLEIEPKGTYTEVTYDMRGRVYLAKGEHDRAISDFTKAIEINPKETTYYFRRSNVYVLKGELDRGLIDITKGIELAPRVAGAYTFRGQIYIQRGDTERAVADFTRAIEIDPKFASAHLGLGRVNLRKGDYDRAIADLSEAMRLNAKDPEPVVERAAAFEAKGLTERALEEYRAALALPANSPTEREAHAEARRRVTAIESRKVAAAPKAVETPPPTAVATRPDRRVALIIANSNYSSVSRLANPAHDGRAIAASFRRLGFAEVIERYDLDQAAMGKALKEFGDKAAGADWAVVYYAGHGIELNGVSYLLPVDAKLERDTHVSDEAISLGRVLEKVEGAQKFRLVILDACRNNPFVSRMVRSVASRSIGRGLAQIEPESGVLVAYAAKHGTTAEDGTNENSPFAQALLAYLEDRALRSISCSARCVIRCWLPPASARSPIFTARCRARRSTSRARPRSKHQGGARRPKRPRQTSGRRTFRVDVLADAYQELPQCDDDRSGSQSTSPKLLRLMFSPAACRQRANVLNKRSRPVPARAARGVRSGRPRPSSRAPGSAHCARRGTD